MTFMGMMGDECIIYKSIGKGTFMYMLCCIGGVRNRFKDCEEFCNGNKFIGNVYSIICEPEQTIIVRDVIVFPQARAFVSPQSPNS